jgi:preprotein translocase subunit SecY
MDYILIVLVFIISMIWFFLISDQGTNDSYSKLCASILTTIVISQLKYSIFFVVLFIIFVDQYNRFYLKLPNKFYKCIGTKKNKRNRNLIFRRVICMKRIRQSR